MYKNIAVLLCLMYAVFGGGFLDLLDSPKPQPKPPAKILNIEKPRQEIIDRVSIFSDMIKDPDDRAKIAIFNYDFANRVTSYSATSQNVNDVYTLAGKIFFKETLVDKYEGLSEEIIKLMEEIMQGDNHSLDQIEKQKLNEYFIAVSWVLIQKG